MRLTRGKIRNAFLQSTFMGTVCCFAIFYCNSLFWLIAKKMKTKTTNAFLLVWCSEGLETVIPISKYEDAQRHGLFETIKSGKKHTSELDGIISALLLRARFNQHRYYEIYAIDCSEEITKEQLFDSFDTDPNGMAKLIRSKGIHIDGIPMSKSKTKIY